MKTDEFGIHVSESIGSVSARAIVAESPRALMILAHGAGAGMDHPFLVKLATLLADERITTVRFNFPYMEKRSKRPDVPAVAEKAILRATEAAMARYPELPVILSGKSFGGRMASHLLCKQTMPEVRALIFYGFPLHAPGNPGTERASHLTAIKVPMLFLQGTRDTLAEKGLIESVCNGLPGATLMFFEGADHSFRVGKKEQIVDLAKKTSDWLDSLQIR